MLSHPEPEAMDDHIAADVVRIYEGSCREYGAPKKRALAKEDVVVPRRRIKRIMGQKYLVSTYICKKRKPHAAKVNVAEAPNLRNREIMRHAASDRRDARLVKVIFATPQFLLTDIDMFHMDRSSEFANSNLDEPLEAFDIRRFLSRKGVPMATASPSPPTRF